MLWLAYLANVAILVPIGLSTLLGVGDPAQGRFVESDGWRTLTGCLWTGILVMSLVGLVYPLAVAPLLAMQVVYKGLWLALWAAPRWLRGRGAEVPPGIAACFAVIVVVWPLILPWSEIFNR